MIQRVGNQRAYLLCLQLIIDLACLARKPAPPWRDRTRRTASAITMEVATAAMRRPPPPSLSLPRQSQAAYRCYSLHLEVYAARDIVISVGFKHGTHTVGVYLVQSTTDTAWS